MKKVKYFSRFVVRVVVLSLVIVGVGLFGEKDTKIVQAQTYTVRAEHPRLILTLQFLFWR